MTQVEAHYRLMPRKRLRQHLPAMVFFTILALFALLLVKDMSDRRFDHGSSSGTVINVAADDVFLFIAAIEKWPNWSSQVIGIKKNEESHVVSFVHDNVVANYVFSVDEYDRRLTGTLLTDDPYYTATLELLVTAENHAGMSEIVFRQVLVSNPPFWHPFYSPPGRKMADAASFLKELRDALGTDSR